MPKQRILLVADESDVTTILKFSLPGFEVCVEDNPLHAIETARSFKPHITFIDITRPNAVPRMLAAQFKEIGEVPSVFVTKGAKHRIAGYNYLTKPLSPHKIIACVKKHLGSSGTDENRCQYLGT